MGKAIVLVRSRLFHWFIGGGVEESNKRKRSVEGDEVPPKRMWGGGTVEENTELKEQNQSTEVERDQLLQMDMNPTREGENYDGEGGEGEKCDTFI